MWTNEYVLLSQVHAKRRKTQLCSVAILYIRRNMLPDRQIWYCDELREIFKVDVSNKVDLQLSSTKLIFNRSSILKALLTKSAQISIPTCVANAHAPYTTTMLQATPWAFPLITSSPGPTFLTSTLSIHTTTVFRVAHWSAGRYRRSSGKHVGHLLFLPI